MTVRAQFAERLRDGDPGDGCGAGWAAGGPTDEELWGLAPDPDADPPDDPLLARMPGDLAYMLLEAQPPPAPKPGEKFVPGGWSRPGGTVGAGFAGGGAADATPPGVVLAGLTARAWNGSARVSDDELVGIARSWQRLAAWAAAGELAAVAELSARRDAQVAAGADPHIAEHVTDEVAAALTLTGRAADALVSFASTLQALPATRAALWAGEIDRARAWVIAEAVSGLEPAHVAAVEAAVIGTAGQQTTGQLRAACRRAVLAADPAAADRRLGEAQKDARVETWSEPAGTAALAGRDLPPAEVLAADRRIDALARQLKHAGATLGMDALRARVYTALLLGIPLPALHTQLIPAGTATGKPGTGKPGSGNSGSGNSGSGNSGSGNSGSGGPAMKHAVAATAAVTAAGPPGTPDGQASGEPAGQAPAADTSGSGALELPPVTGTLNLTMPLSTWLGGSAPGDVPGFGPIPAPDAQALARLLATAPGTTICLTLTAPGGAAIAHACTKTGTSQAPASRAARQFPELTLTIRPLAHTGCDHQHQTPGYQPSIRLRHLIVTRQRICAFPGCRRNAAQCDLDHTTPFDAGGRTCECNLAPLCRRHHRAKQTQGWALTQPIPGHLTWTLPHGRTYRTSPGPYPAGGP